MTGFFGFVLDPRGRTDRIGYLLGLFGLLMWLLVLTAVFRARLDDFSGAGEILDAVWKRNFQEYWRLLEGPGGALHTVSLALLLAVYALGVISFLSMTARRLQDMGRPGVYAAAALIVGPPAMVLLLAILPGDRGDNAYGPPPKRRFQFGGKSGGEPGVTGPNTR